MTRILTTDASRPCSESKVVVLNVGNPSKNCSGNCQPSNVSRDHRRLQEKAKSISLFRDCSSNCFPVARSAAAIENATDLSHGAREQIDPNTSSTNDLEQSRGHGVR